MRKIGIGVLLLLAIGLIWYLFIKQGDYTVRFVTNAIPGTINRSLKIWDTDQEVLKEIVQNGDLHSLHQQLKAGDSVHHYHWDLKRLNDTTTQIIVNVKDDSFARSLLNRIKVPFTDSEIALSSTKTVRDFMADLKDHTDSFMVKIIGESEIPTTYNAYLPVKVLQENKAGGMMRNLPYLTSELIANSVELVGPPRLEVTHWDQETDSLHYNFAQPIVRSEKLPIGTEIKYKRIFARPALKAEYYGNYITSDRAWYALMDYAKKHGIEVEAKPIEIFHNNPQMGGNEIEWKCEVYLPIKSTNNG